MNEFKQAKADYNAVIIPEELDTLVRASIKQGQKNYQQRCLKRGFAAMAACLALLIGVLNLSPSAAAIAADIPILSGLFKILTIQNYQQTADGIDYRVSVPEISAEGPFTQQINAAIQQEVNNHLAKAKQDWADYQEAFLDTGGTAEELAQREMNVIVNYEIKSQTDTSVSFVVSLAECWVAANEERYYYNLDLAKNQPISLEMLLGENWVQICNESIQRDIAASADEDGFSYFFPPDEGGFTSVNADTTFYIRADGIPVVTFAEYEIAAGAAGIPEFPIITE